MKLTTEQDAFGHMMYDHLHGKGGFEVIERDDGFFDSSGGPKVYFSPYEEWNELEKQSMNYVKGRVLDIGCGAGRHALHLQAQGFEVLGIDASPLAVKVCQERGVKDARLLSITQVSRRLGIFDTILMMGNNFALLGTPRRARWLLQRFARMTSPEGQIISFNRDPYLTDVPEHLAYHAWKRQQSRLGGEARIRVRYKKFVTPWFDFLMVSPVELQDLLEPTDWAVSTILKDHDAGYAPILTKKDK